MKPFIGHLYEVIDRKSIRVNKVFYESEFPYPQFTGGIELHLVGKTPFLCLGTLQEFDETRKHYSSDVYIMLLNNERYVLHSEKYKLII